MDYRERLPARGALLLAALLQCFAGLYIAWRLLDFLREIIRDPGSWAWLLLLFWIIVCGPIVVWAGLRVLSSFGLSRGNAGEWWASMFSWLVVLVVGAMALVAGRPAAGYVLLAATMLILLRAGRPALRHGATD